MTRGVRAARVTLWVLLSVVALSAVLLSFAALRDLGTAVKFGDLSALVPVVFDAGAAVGTLVWLARWAPIEARQFGRTMALVLGGASVGGNALEHGLSAAHVDPHWLVAVGIAAIVSGVVFASVHLVVLVVDGGSWALGTSGTSGTEYPESEYPEVLGPVLGPVPAVLDEVPAVPAQVPAAEVPALHAVPPVSDRIPVEVPDEVPAVPPVLPTRTPLHMSRLAELRTEYRDEVPAASAIRRKYRPSCNLDQARRLHDDLTVWAAAEAAS